MIDLDDLDVWYVTKTDIEQIDEPGWGERGRVHDWRNHVPLAIMKKWDDLSRESRFLVFAMAAEQAHNETWD